MILRFTKELYPKLVLLKAAYTFIDRAYLHLDADDNNYVVEITPKTNEDTLSANEFKNEMLIQSVRYEVFQNTKSIRELIIARSLASTIIDKNNDFSDSTELSYYKESEVLKDWFDSDD